MDKIEELQKIIKNSKKIVFFGGAGVSTASGIPDFRSANGLYSKTPEYMVSHEYWLYHPNKFYEFYFTKMVYKNAKPNICHLKLAEWEKAGKDITIVTQNIDGLHQMAGSKNVIELHGSIYRNHCTKCNRFYKLSDFKNSGIPKCTCGGIIKPDVVLYGENLNTDDIENAVSAISDADTLIVCGTSLAVYPAASFLKFFAGENLIVINRDVTSADKNAKITIHDDIKGIFSKL